MRMGVQKWMTVKKRKKKEKERKEKRTTHCCSERVDWRGDVLRMGVCGWACRWT